MIFLITGSSHVGKTLFAQKLLKKYLFPYLSIDHLKMGLIRAGYTELTPLSDGDELTAYLWPVVREMIKTAIENDQHLIVEGCYIPFNWADDFEQEYLEHIQYCCLIMSETYIRRHFDDIRGYANVIERRLDDDCSLEELVADNVRLRALAESHHVRYVLIDDTYDIDWENLL